MFLLSIHFAILILILATLNFVGVNILQGKDRFWLPPIVLWLFLFFLFIVIRQFNLDDQQTQQTIYELRAGRDPAQDAYTAKQLEANGERYGAFSRRMIHLLGVQAILAALSQLWGYQHTGERYYRSALLTFLALAFIYAVVALLVI
ncbi:MAG: hypothetical protein JWP69_2395 [Flaviaesturariibacter sp.]|nr:hypothetical protein [Flaviaesturariibacter sp.]